MLNRDAVYIAKGLGIALVVIGHYNVPNVQPDWWISIRKIIYTFHMPLFMFLSGYLFGNKGRALNSPEEYFEVLKSKANRLMYPYITISLILLLVKYCAGLFFKLQHPIDLNFYKYILVDPADGFATLLWFIYTLFIIFTIFPLFIKVLKNDVFLVVIVILLSFISWPDFFCLNLVFHFLPFFTLGYLVRHRKIFENRMPGTSIAVALIVFILSILLLLTNKLSFNDLNMKILKFISGVSGLYACIFFAKMLEKNDIFPVLINLRNWLKILGLYSSGIYLLHTLSMGPARITFFQIAKLGKPFFVPSAILVCCVGLLIPILIEKYLIRPSPMSARYILGINKNITIFIIC